MKNLSDYFSRLFPIRDIKRMCNNINFVVMKHRSVSDARFYLYTNKRHNFVLKDVCLVLIAGRRIRNQQLVN